MSEEKKEAKVVRPKRKEFEKGYKGTVELLKATATYWRGYGEGRAKATEEKIVKLAEKQATQEKAKKEKKDPVAREQARIEKLKKRIREMESKIKDAEKNGTLDQLSKELEKKGQRKKTKGK